MKIRDVTEKDLGSIRFLSDQISLQHHLEEPDTFAKPIIDQDRDRGFWLALLKKENESFLLAESDGEVCGFVTFRFTEGSEATFLVDRKTCRVGTIVVSEQYQNQGVGQKLMEAVEALAVAEKATEIRLEVMDFNKQAQSFYKKQAFQTHSHILKKKLLF